MLLQHSLNNEFLNFLVLIKLVYETMMEEDKQKKCVCNVYVCVPV